MTSGKFYSVLDSPRLVSCVPQNPFRTSRRQRQKRLTSPHQPGSEEVDGKTWTGEGLPRFLPLRVPPTPRPPTPFRPVATLVHPTGKPRQWWSGSVSLFGSDDPSCPRPSFLGRRCAFFPSRVDLRSVNGRSSQTEPRPSDQPTFRPQGSSDPTRVGPTSTRPTPPSNETGRRRTQTETSGRTEGRDNGGKTGL